MEFKEPVFRFTTIIFVITTVLYMLAFKSKRTECETLKIQLTERTDSTADYGINLCSETLIILDSLLID